MQGDPGLFGFLGKAAGSVASAIGSFAPGPAGALLRKVGSGLTARASGAIGAGQAILKQIPFPSGGLPGLPFSGAGFRNDMGVGPTGSRAGLKKDGTPRRVKKNGQFWKRPSMNFGNGRAIKRAARRLEGAEELFKRVFSIRHGKRPVGVTPKKGR
jgi:hypothetical protein